jgi:hypothetical protein
LRKLQLLIVFLEHGSNFDMTVVWILTTYILNFQNKHGIHNNRPTTDQIFFIQHTDNERIN